MKLLLLWPVVGLFAQESFYLDLRGEWRYKAGDDAQYREAAFDDGQWRSIELPMPVRRRRTMPEWYWLRRTVELSSRPEAGLTLTVGAVSEAFEVYVNGQEVGRTGAFVLEQLQLARPRTFDLPASVVARKMTIAVRVWNSPDVSPAAWTVPDTGPWVLTGRDAAPREAGRSAIEHHQLDRAPDLHALVVLAFGIVVLLIWVKERSRWELFWLGVYLVVVAVGRLDLFFHIQPESRPFGTGRLRVTLLVTLVPAALLAQFASAALRIRWLPWLVWPVALAGLWAGTRPFSGQLNFVITAVNVFTLVGLAAGLMGRGGATVYRGLVALGVVATLLTHSWQWGGITRVMFGTDSLRSRVMIGAFSYSWHLLVVTVFSFAFAVDLVRRLLRDRAERQRLAGEFEAARAAQQFLIPVSPACTERYEVAAAYEPALEVGGDFYCSLPLDDGGLVVAVGDVSGKGMKAAMVVSMMVGVLRSHRQLSPGRLLDEVNRTIVGSLDGGFVTCVVARFEPCGQVRLANAGHLAPYANGVELELEAGLPLGVVAEVGYVECERELACGQCLTFVTDGVVEAAGGNGELFGFERTRIGSQNRARDLAESARAWGQNDDITVVTVRRTA